MGDTNVNRNMISDLIHKCLNSVNWKILVSVFQDIIGPIVMVFMFMFAFVLDLIDKIEDPWVKFSVGILILAMAMFYIARFRKIWKEGTQIHRQNQKRRK